MKFVTPSIVILILIALSVGYGVLYMRLADGIARAESALARSNTLAKRDALVRSQELFLNQNTEMREAVNALVITNDTVVYAIERIEQTAQRANVALTISAVNAVSETSWEHHEHLDIQFSASGTFARMQQFIAALESLPEAARVEEVSLEVGDSGTWFGTFTVTFVKTK